MYIYEVIVTNIGRNSNVIYDRIFLSHDDYISQSEFYTLCKKAHKECLEKYGKTSRNNLRLIFIEGHGFREIKPNASGEI